MEIKGMFDETLEKILRAAIEKAKKEKFKVFSLEHLLLAILMDRRVLLRTHKIDVRLNKIKKLLEEYLKNPDLNCKAGEVDIDFSPEAASILRVTDAGMKDSSKEHFCSDYLLLTILHKENSEICKLLEEQGLSYAFVKQTIRRKELRRKNKERVGVEMGKLFANTGITKAMVRFASTRPELIHSLIGQIRAARTLPTVIVNK